MKVLTAISCPKCKKKRVLRLGYDRERGGSHYYCQTCKDTFLVPTLRLHVAEKRG